MSLPVATRLMRWRARRPWCLAASPRPHTLLRAVLCGMLWLGASSSSFATLLTISGTDDGWVTTSPMGFRLDMSFDRMTDDHESSHDIQGYFALEAGPRTAFVETSRGWAFHHGLATWAFELTWRGRTGKATGRITDFAFGIESPDGDAGLTWDTVTLTSPVFSRSMRRMLRSDTTGIGWLDWIADGWHHTGYDPDGEMDSRIYTRGNGKPLQFGVTAPLPVPEPACSLSLMAAGATTLVLRARRGRRRR